MEAHGVFFFSSFLLCPSPYFQCMACRQKKGQQSLFVSHFTDHMSTRQLLFFWDVRVYSYLAPFPCPFFSIDDFLDNSGQDLAQCCYRLLDSEVFQQNTLAVTNSIIERAIQVSFLLPLLLLSDVPLCSGVPSDDQRSQKRENRETNRALGLLV